MPFDKHFDCVIVGGGPAGLSAAIYLARFRRCVLVVDGGDSRASAIPCTRNVPGFPEGIAGLALLDRMREQAARYGANFLFSTVSDIIASDGAFQVEAGAGRHGASAILLATGVANVVPDFAQRDEALARGKLRYCPICDAYEVMGKRIAIIGNSVRSANEQAFLRTYTDEVSLFAVDAAAHAAMCATGARIDDYAQTVRLDGEDVIVETTSGRHRFDALYSCLGVHSKTALATRLGVALSENQEIVTDAHQRTNIRFVYAAGDVVAALDQIAVAIGHGAIAATTIHNDLRKQIAKSLA